MSRDFDELVVLPDRSDRNEIDVSPKWQILESSREHFGAFQLKLAHGLTQKRRLPLLRLNHRQVQSRPSNLERESRRTAARSQIEPSEPTVHNERRSRQRLDKQAIEGLVGWLGERKGSEVDSCVPARQKPEIRLERGNFRVV